MSKSPNVLVTVGSSSSPKLPKQDYDNIHTKYNIGPPASDGSFFNKSVLERRSSSTDFDSADTLLYGFFSGKASFTENTSLQKIVSFFQKSDLIDVVVCDFIVKKNGFDSYLYTHYSDESDIPFFVHARAIHLVNFSNGPSIYQKQIQDIRSKGCPVFHLAEPVLTLDGRL